MTEDTAKWLEGLRRQDESMVGELVKTYGEPLKRYLSAMVRNRSVLFAQDHLLEDFFRRIHHKRNPIVLLLAHE